jgi:hypothetical protein
MQLKFILRSLVVSFIVFTVHPSEPKGVQQRYDLTIVYTNDVLGEIEPCG